MSVNVELTEVRPGLSEVDVAVRAVLADRLIPARIEIDKLHDTTGDLFSGRLLSLNQAESLNSGLRTIKVAPGTVVTPLARDYLKQRGIAILFVSKREVEQVRNQGEWGFAIASNSGLIEAYRRNLLSAREGWIEVGTTIEHSITWLSEKEGRGVMHLTDDAAVAVFLGCQIPSVRASVAHDVESTARAVRTLGVNLLVVEPAGKSIAFLRQVGISFRRAGGPVAPQWLTGGAR